MACVCVWVVYTIQTRPFLNQPTNPLAPPTHPPTSQPTNNPHHHRAGHQDRVRGPRAGGRRARHPGRRPPPGPGLLRGELCVQCGLTHSLHRRLLCLPIHILIRGELCVGVGSLHTQSLLRRDGWMDGCMACYAGSCAWAWAHFTLTHFIGACFLACFLPSTSHTFICGFSPVSQQFTPPPPRCRRESHHVLSHSIHIPMMHQWQRRSWPPSSTTGSRCVSDDHMGTQTDRP